MLGSLSTKLPDYPAIRRNAETFQILSVVDDLFNKDRRKPTSARTSAKGSE